MNKIKIILKVILITLVMVILINGICLLLRVNYDLQQLELKVNSLENRNYTKVNHYITNNPPVEVIEIKYDDGDLILKISQLEQKILELTPKKEEKKEVKEVILEIPELQNMNEE